MRPRSELLVSGRIQVMRNATLSIGYDAKMRIGDGTYFNDGSHVVCDAQMTFGPGCAIAWDALVSDTDVHKVVAGEHCAPVDIGAHCWIGAKSVILKGTTLGEGAVVAAGAVVTRDVPAHCLVAGAPAKVLLDNIDWRL